MFRRATFLIGRRCAATTLALLTAACAQRPADVPGGSAPPLATVDPGAPGATAVAVHPGPRESHLARLWRLTHGGQNAEGYFSADATQIIFQGRRAGQAECDQIYTMDLNGANRRLVSTGEGRTTCGYFFPSGDRILYSSTHLVGRACPPEPDRSRGYVWPLYDYDIFTASADGSDLRRLTTNPGYDAEATISGDGASIVFTSERDGDLDIYVMDATGGNVRRLTSEIGYDGGPFFSPDGSKIVYRAHHPTDSAAIADYRALLEAGLIRPARIEIMVMDASGSNKRQLTTAGAASFAPFFHPDGRRIIFSSNMHDPTGRSFSLYMIDVDGTNLERLTHDEAFDGFPMFSPDGRRLIFASSRGAREPGEINLFIADWVDAPAPAR